MKVTEITLQSNKIISAHTAYLRIAMWAYNYHYYAYYSSWRELSEYYQLSSFEEMELINILNDLFTN